MSAPDPDAFRTLPRPLRDENGPVFAEAWQAQAFAMAIKLVASKNLSNPVEMHARKEAWADAYRHTPHGKPVELRKSKGERGSP